MEKYIVLGIIGIIIYIIVIYNKLVYYKKVVDRSGATIDVFLKKRFDLIPNLVEVVKGYSNYEKSTLENITRLRSSYNENKNKEAVSKLTEEYYRAIGIVENYPELKASHNYLKLQESLEKVESELQAARRIYNIDITRYNNLVEKFPSNILASMFGYKTIEYPIYKFDDVKVNFD